MCVSVCGPVELQYLCDRAEDGVDVGEAQDGSVGVQGGCERFVVHLRDDRWRFKLLNVSKCQSKCLNVSRTFITAPSLLR